MTEMNMRITVVLCTYNRCRSLAKALESVAVSELPGSAEWEVLVVDNNSRDQTRDVVEGFCARYPGHFRYVFEPQPGKSYALNRGIREAHGEVLAFMDDDVVVEPTWLSFLTAPFQDSRWAGAGGRIAPESGFTCPRWLALHGPYAMGGVLALFDRGDKPTELDWAPYGTNMAFRRTMFEKYGGFRTELGPAPGSEIRNEDTDFGRRVMDAGEHLFYEPAAVVYHEIPQTRVSKEYFLTWWFDYGRAEIRVREKRPDLAGVPRHYFSVLNHILRMLPRKALEWLMTSEPQERFFKKCWLWECAGETAELWLGSKKSRVA